MAEKSYPRKAFEFLAPASVQPQDDASSPSDRTLTGVAYSGGIVTDHGYWSRLVIDLASASLTPPIPLLSCHEHDDSVGVVTAATQQAGGLAIEAVLFASIDEDAADIAAKADRGFPWQLSVGIWPDSIEEVQAGASIQLNGQSFQGPLTVFRNSRIREVSVVPVGADSRTSAAVLSAGESISIPVISHEDDTMNLDEAKAKIAELEGKLAQLSAGNGKPDPTKYVELSVMQGVQAELSATKGELAAIKSAQFEAELSAVIEEALADGRILPPQKDDLLEFGRTNLAGLKSFLEKAQPNPALLGTQTRGRAPTGGAAGVGFKVPAGTIVDASSLELHSRAVAYMDANKTDYLTAVQAVSH